MIAIVLLLWLSAMAITTTAGEPWWICDNTGNYSSYSRYQANIESLSIKLPSNASSTSSLFAMGSAGAVPDTVYGLALCRGDANTSSCMACLAAAFPGALGQCGRNKEAIVFYDLCLLRHSDQDYNDHVSTPTTGDRALPVMNAQDAAMPVLPGWDPGDAGSVVAITNTVRSLLLETAQHAAYNSTRKYSTGCMDVGGAFPPLYSLAQCTPDLTPVTCWKCLQSIGAMATSSFAGKQGGRVLSVRCNLRFDTARFYDGEPMLRMVPPPDGFVPPKTAPSNKPKRSMSKVLIIALVVPLLASMFCFTLYIRFIRTHVKGAQDKAKVNAMQDEALVWGLEDRMSEFIVFNFPQVLEATGYFSEENKLGQGGFGPVYKGEFPDGLEVAVKRLASHSGQGFLEFKNEIQLIAKLQHINLVRLLGCCSQGEEKTLVYEYCPNKSLDFYIFDDKRRALLDWTRRLLIIEGIAEGLIYLHKHSRLRVIHRDLKASNILLDREMNPKISDFGLAKIFNPNDTEGNTRRIVGTYGYMAPEYALEGLFSVKSDVFSFGVLILEIVSGKRTSSLYGYGEFINLQGHAWQLWKDGLWHLLIDASLVTEVTEVRTIEMMRCINIALLCVQENASDRPTVSHVVSMLSSESMTLPEPKHPAYFHRRVTTEEVSTIVDQSTNHVTISVLDGR